MNLRDQIDEIATRKIGPEFVAAVQWPVAVNTLARHLFLECDVTSQDARAVHRAMTLLQSPGWVTDEEPAVD